MSSVKNIKVHTRIGHERSLCGLAPMRGNYRIVSFSSFFSATAEDQCGKCIKRLQEHGYNIERERLKFRTVYDHAQELALIP
ncbi:MAG: hypothetical protein B7Y56_03150 [Gallionellales bacterium 35-53-114]|jgi:hypothetical protein|nr:MAG: hypothetical protein B7Y56_03150 [Gallionellales bacterium 35-53-114]OYZ65105.1 MAG: hypothetical protein B7Y04_00310 [Gallionellales bacterium 24-53-125]OZB08014.1 MAG: hypothetical protein B7X61_10760 [Gallionellales bacterium 39-52-133]HQS59755.1 hypothetical protein [Gallionellaceae bacterium]HQS76509.1 hypothetical protein [Gallionellaceae bacterium]